MKRNMCRVAYSDGRQEDYPVTPSVELAFERLYKKPVNPKTFEGEGGTRLTYALAFEAMRTAKAKAGEVVPPPGSQKDMDDWVETLVVIDVEGEELVPFVAAGSDTSSTLPSTPE